MSIVQCEGGTSRSKLDVTPALIDRGRWWQTSSLHSLLKRGLVCAMLQASSPRTHSITSSTPSIRSVHFPHPTNPFSSTPPQFYKPLPVLRGPVWAQRVFEHIREPIRRRRNMQRCVHHLRIPALPNFTPTPQRALNLSRNENGAGLEESAPGAVPASGRNSRVSRIRGAEEELFMRTPRSLVPNISETVGRPLQNRRVVVFTYHSSC